MADELKGNSALNMAMADYHIMRNQSRICSGSSMPIFKQCDK